MKTECEICKYQFTPKWRANSEFVVCPLCAVETDPHRPPQPKDSNDDNDGNGYFWAWMILSTGLFLTCCVGAVVMAE